MHTIEKLLLIDDSEATNNFHNRLLGKLNFAKEITTCKNGEEGLNYLKLSNNCPDLIFLDLNMPVLDGFEFLPLAADHLSNSYEKLPLVIILTSSEEPVDQERCKKLYENLKFYSKPLTIDQINQIKELINN